MGITTVLVTGAGSLLGQGVLRCLRASARPLRILTADPDHRASGHWLGDAGFRIPMASDPAYLTSVEALVARERPDVLLVGTDVELPIFARERGRLEAAHEMRVVVSPPRVVEIADDKIQTAQFLEQNGFAFPRSATAADRDAVGRLLDTVGLPVFAKPRRGARSIGARVVADRDALDAACAREPNLVIQELLPEENGEYTSGCLVTGGRCGGVVVLRRDLREGNTFRAYRDAACAGFDRFVSAVAERLGVDGPCNFQFRVRGGEPVVFEINARFSGTTPIRAIFGFNEVEALLAHLLDGAPIPSPRLRAGAVFRTTSDLFVEPADLARFADAGTLQAPRAEELAFRVPRRR